MNFDYKIDGIMILLNEDCILNRYYPLIPSKNKILSFLKSKGVIVKSDCDKISDEEFIENGFDLDFIKRFRFFLSLYDPKPEKSREVEKLNVSDNIKTVYRELYLLPGVKETRASLYYKSGIRSLKDIASLSANELIEKCKTAIEKEQLAVIPPLPKEAKTHIAVAKAFTL